MKIKGSWLRRQKKKTLMVLVEASRTFPSRWAVQLIDWHILICFPELGGWLWRQRSWCFNVSSLLIYSRSLRKFLSKSIVFIWFGKKRIHVVNVTSNGLSDATTGHTLFRFRILVKRSWGLLIFQIFSVKASCHSSWRFSGLGVDSARNWPFTFTFMPIPPPPLSCWGILLYAYVYD